MFRWFKKRSRLVYQDSNCEHNGACIWPDENLCPNSPLAACRLVAIAADRGPLSALLDQSNSYPIRRTNVQVASDVKTAVMTTVTERVRETYDDVSTLDGVLIGLDDSWRLIPASGTRPLISVTPEAHEATRADQLLEEEKGHVNDAMTGQ